MKKEKEATLSNRLPHTTEGKYTKLQRKTLVISYLFIGKNPLKRRA